MIIAGPCLYVDDSMTESIIKTAERLQSGIDLFRCKLWGGGTAVSRWFDGIGQSGIKLLEKYNSITEVQTPEQLHMCWRLAGVWIGARSCQNYGLLKEVCKHPGFVMVKRHPGMTIDEIVNLHDICKQKYNKDIYLIERGINTLDRNYGRWCPDIKFAYVVKRKYPELLKRIVIDCSHSAGDKDFIGDIYQAFKAIGIKHFMFEVYDGEPKTDIQQNLTSDEFFKIISEFEIKWGN